MKTSLKLALLIAALSVGCFGQAGLASVPGKCPEKWSFKTAVSATSITIPNDCGGMTATFEEVITGSPATMSAVLSGCMAGGNCTVLETYTGTTTSIRKPTLDSVYDYFTLVPTWTGGTSPTFAVNNTITISRNGSSAGGLIGDSPIVISGGHASCPTCGVGTGNFTGPGSSVAGNVITFTDTTGHVGQDAGFGFPLDKSHIGTLASGSNGLAASATTDTTNATNIASGTLNHARLPALVSGDIPNNAANTSGNATTASTASLATAFASTPSLCSSGQAPRGVDINGNPVSCFAPTAGPGGSSGTLQGNHSGALDGVPTTTYDFTTGLIKTAQITPSLIGVGNQSRCYTGSLSFAALKDCTVFAEVTNGLRTSEVFAVPEHTTQAFLPVNYHVNLHILPDSATSTLCTSLNIHCLVVDHPIVITAGTIIQGLGPVTKGGNFSGGSAIFASENFPAPVGLVTAGSMTCTGTGGTYPATVYVAESKAVNLQTYTGTGVPSASLGLSAYSKTAVTGCAGATGMTINPPTGGNAGSLTPKDFVVGVATSIDGTYWVQVPGTNLTCATPGLFALGCSLTGGGAATLGTIAANTHALPMSEKSGNPSDTSNVLLAIGSLQSVSFNSNFRDMTFACQPTGHGSNNPNVLVWNVSGEEGTGNNSGALTLYGDCGGYTGIAGAMLYSDPMTPNSSWTHTQISGGPTSGSTEFAGMILDGRGNSIDWTGAAAGASGCPRDISDVTIALRDGGTNETSIISQGVRCWTGINHSHFENNNANDNVYVTDGAKVNISSAEGFTSGTSLHFTSTAGPSTVNGFCAQGTADTHSERCQSSAIAIQDDADTTGNMPLLGEVANWSTIGSQNYLGSLKVSGDTTLYGNLSSVPPSGKAGMFSFVGNTADQTIPTNQFAWGGFSITSATAYGLKPPNTAPSGGQVLNCPTPTSGWSQCSWSSAGSGTVTSVGSTVNGGSSSGIFAITGSPVTTSGTVNLTTTGTSGGILCFTSGTLTASSSALTTGRIVAGGGAGACPTAANNPQLNSAGTPSAVGQAFTNDGTTGTTNGLIAKISASNTIVKVSTSDVVAEGIVITGGGTSGTAQLARTGSVACTFDNTSVAGDYVQNSTTTAGDCHDSGSTYPSSGSVILGTVVDAGVAGSHNVSVRITPVVSAGGGSASSTVSVKTADYSLSASTDCGGTFVMNSATGHKFTLPGSALSNPCTYTLMNEGTATANIDNNGLTINGKALAILLRPQQGRQISTDGSNFFASSKFFTALDTTRVETQEAIAANSGSTNSGWQNANNPVCTTYAYLAPTATNPGMGKCTTGTGANATSNIWLDSNSSNRSFWTFGKNNRVVIYGQLVNSTTVIRMKLCFSGDGNPAANSLGAATYAAGDGFCLRYDTGAGDTNFMLCTADGTTETCTSTGVAADTAVHTVILQQNSVLASVQGCVDSTCITKTTNVPLGGGVATPSSVFYGVNNLTSAAGEFSAYARVLAEGDE